MFDAKEHARDVDADDSFEVFFLVVDDSRLARVGYPRVVHHDVELAECFDGGFNGSFDLGFVCDVAVDVEGVGGAAKCGGA